MSDNGNKSFPKRHCMVVHAYYPLGEPRVEREAKALIEKGYEVDVICLRNTGEDKRDFQEGVNIYRLPVKRHKGKGQLVQLIEYLTFFFLVSITLPFLYFSKRYRVIQVHNLPDFLIFSALVPRIFGAKLILDYHDLMPEFFASLSEKGMQSLPVKILIFQEQLSSRFAHHVITVTENWKDTLVSRGTQKDKVSVVMNVADSNIFFREPQHKFQIKKGEPIKLIYHGTITYRYGIDLLIEAVSKVCAEIPNIHLTIHGRGEYLEELKDLVEYLHLENIVTFSSQLIPISDLSKMIRESHIGIVPNRNDVFTDGILPTKMMEYFAVGLPVIVAKTTTISSYVSESMARFFIPEDVNGLSDNIIDLVSNLEECQRYVENSNEFITRYNWAKISAGYISLVDKLQM